MNDQGDLFGGRDTLADYRRRFYAILKNGKYTHCDVCGKHAKLDNRPFNYSMACWMLYFFEACKDGRRFAYFGDAAPWLRNSNQYSTLKHWGLLQPASDFPEEERRLRPPTKKTSGYWITTPKAREWVYGEIAIPKRVLIYNDEPLAFREPGWTIEDALDLPFNYHDLEYIPWDRLEAEHVRQELEKRRKKK